VLFSPAAAVQAIADLTATLADHSSLGVDADCLIWIDGCGAVEPPRLRALQGAAGPGTAVVLGAAEGQTAAALSALVNVIVIAGRGPAELGRPHAPGGQALPAGLLSGRQPDDLAVFTRSSGRLLVGRRVPR
jgi:hypothetical protein